MKRIDVDLLVVGNGLDIQLDFKTRYEDFYNFIELCLKTTNKDYYKRILCAFLNEKIEYEKYKNRGFCLLVDYIKKVNTNNFFINYFHNYKEKFNNWNSFEDELTYILTSLDDLFWDLKKLNTLFIGYDNQYKRIIKKMEIQSFVEYIRFVECSKNNNIINIEWYKGNYNSLIIGLGCEEIVPKDEKVLQEKFMNLISKIPGKLFDELIIYSKIFSFYINVFVFDGRDAKYEKLNIGASRCVNYNYTVTASNYLYDNVPIRVKTCHINGNSKLYSLEDLGTTYIKLDLKGMKNLPRTNIVFGVSKQDFKDDAFMSFNKQIQRIVKNTDYKDLSNFIMNSNKEYEKYSIAILGHSLSECDFESLKFIYNSVKTKYAINDLKFYLIYYDDKDMLNKTNNLKKIVDKDFSEIMYSSGIEKININNISIEKDANVN